MKFREWFESKRRADHLCWADEEAAATAWDAALELAAESCDRNLWRTAAECADAIRALKEQA